MGAEEEARIGIYSENRSAPCRKRPQVILLLAFAFREIGRMAGFLSRVGKCRK